MKTTIARLAVGLSLAAGLVLPLGASGQTYSSGEQQQYRPYSGYGSYAKDNSPEGRYCNALVERFYNYVASPYDYQFRRRYTATVGVAAAQCEQGQYASAIPTLEQALTNAKVALPPRG